MNEKANKNGGFQEAETSGNEFSRTENPCVDGSIPHLATCFYNNLPAASILIIAKRPDIRPDTTCSFPWLNVFKHFSAGLLLVIEGYFALLPFFASMRAVYVPYSAGTRVTRNTVNAAVMRSMSLTS